MNGEYNFTGVTLLITHYNRSGSLARLLSTFQKLNCRFEEIVVADDGSKPDILEKVKALQPVYNFRLVTSPQNKGFANNMNKGQDAVNTPYVLYVQEDFVPTGLFPTHFADALQFMNEKNDLDIIRFWSFFTYPTLKPYGKGFSEMVYSPWNMNHLKFYYYSDNPHLRRGNFTEKFGRYQEGIKGDLTEYRMALSFLKKKGRGLFYNEFSTLFTHENSPDEPSTQERANWRQSKNVFFLFLRWFYLRYRWLKCTIELKNMDNPKTN